MRILIVEDEATVAQAIEALLVNHHYAVDKAADGLAGLEMAEAYSYDLLLLDIGLPQIDGVSLCQKLRAEGVQAPILLLTGQEAEAHAKAIALNAGADDYVTKPFDAEELLARIHSLLRRGDLRSPPTLQWGSLTIDPSRLQVSYGTTLLHLTPKEYGLLEVLLRHAPNIVSIRTILEQGWNALETPGEEVVRYHLKELRKKLRAAGAPEDFIKTMHRQGYRLNPLYGEAAFDPQEESTATMQMAEVKAVNEELRKTLEQLQATQAELQQRNQELQAVHDELKAQVAERTLAMGQQEAFLSSIYDGASHPIFVVAVTETGDFRYLSHNQVAQETIGIPLEEVRDKTPEALFGPEVGAQFRRYYEQCVQARHSIVFDNHFVFQGRSVWTLTTLAPLFDATGRVYQLVGTGVDITDRKQAEIALRESEAQQTFLLNLSDSLRPLNDPIAIQQKATELVAHYLGVTRALYYEVDPDQNRVTKVAGFEASPVGLPDRLRLSDFGTDLAAAFRAGRTLVVRDATVEPQLEAQREAYRAINVRAGVVVPLVQNGQLTVLLGVDQPTPRDWTNTEVQILEAVADRTWAAVERVRSEEHLRLFVTASSDIVYRMSADWQYIRYIEGNNWLDNTETPCPYRLATYIPPEAQDQVWAAIQEAIRTKSVFELEHPVIRQDGTTGWVFSRAVPRLNKLGDIVEWFGAASDVTERKQAEAALAQSEERYRHLVELAPQLVWHANAQGHTYISPQLSEYTGLPSDQLVSFDWQTVIHSEDFDSTHRRWIESVQTGIPYEAEYRLRRADGQYRWHLVRAIPISHGQEMQWFGVSIDIHDRKQLELALRDSETQLSRIFDNAGAAIGEFSAYPDHTYVHGLMSVGCETVYGYSQAEWTGDTHLWQSRVVPEDFEGVIIPAYENIFAQKSFSIEYRFRDKTNTIRWIAETLNSQWDEAAGCWQVTTVAIDISDRKQAEQSLQQSEAKNRAILAALPDLIIQLSAEGIYREVFSSSCKFDVLSVDAIGQSIFDVVPPAMAEQTYISLQRALQTGELQVFEQEVPIGNHLQYEEVRVVKSADDEVLLVIRDISPQKQLEAERKQAELALQQLICQEQLVADIAQEIRQSLDLNQVLYSAVVRVRELLACDRVVIFRFRPDWQGDVVMEAVGNGCTAILSTTIVDPCLQERFIEPYHHGHVSVLNDIHQPGLTPCYVEFLQQFQVRASLVVPILQGDDLWGLLMAHQCSAPRQWQTNEVEMLQRLATQVGIASQQSELYEQTRRELLARQQMQAVLEASEARFRSLSAAAPIGICQTNADGICLYVNPCWVEISGRSLEDNLGDGWLQSVHPDDRAMLATAWASYLQGGSDTLPEFRLLTPKGEIRWISARIAAIKSAAGEVIGYVSADEDITERKQAEETLRESRQRLQAILDYSPAAIYLIDPQNRHLLVNRSYASMLFTTPETLVGKSLYEVWPAEAAEGFAAQNRTILETGQLLQTEDSVPLKDGTHSYITVKFPLYDATGKAYAIGGISTDITERKQLEAQLYQAQRLESLGTLASGIAHDLNNLLAPILTTAQLLRLSQKGLDDKGLEFVDLLENSAKRGAGLVKQILSVTRTSQGEQTAVDLAALLHDEMEIIRHSFPKSIEIVANVPSPGQTPSALGMILADPSYLHQIILNLCINARDAMAEGGTLTVSATRVFVDEAMAAHHLEARVGDYAVITVADTGTGISPEVQERMFDPFFTTKAPGQGTGLGLATVRGLVKANQGFLQVFSEVGQGTQFKVYFPLIENEAPEPEPIDPSSAVSLDKPEAFVLVVEDEDTVRSMLQSILETHDYRTLLAQHGADALEQYRQHQADIQLVVTDLMMPIMDGFTLIEHLKGINPEIPILAISGVPTHEETALTAGADYFLAKPFDLKTLLSQIATLLTPDGLPCLDKN